jgi:hypothetical protein
MFPIPRRPFSFLAIALLSFMPSPAWANFAWPFLGVVNSEAWGVKEITITAEHLVIDLRPLASADPARVEVHYELNNSGGPRHFDLLFVSGEVKLSEFEALVNDRLVETRVLSWQESQDLWTRAPKSWRPPHKAPGLEGGETFYGYRKSEMELVTLPVELPSGPSTLRVRYLAHACGTDERPTITWQFPYVLAPAREWGGFDRLDVDVYLPAGWEGRSTPALEREGDGLRGSFEGVPADALMIATGPPVPAEYHWAVWSSVVIWVVVLVGGWAICWSVGRQLGVAQARTRLAGEEVSPETRFRHVVVKALPAVILGPLIYASVPLCMAMIRGSLHGQQNPSIGLRLAMGSFCALPLIVPMVIALWILTFWSASRSARRTETG